ncbi:MAG: head-tail connector protein [Vagococcus sp.]|uniref:head-tail connector protein n=1 Tax=Vagococcus sp. TaxID=1933889 RepID=UPI002FC6AE97
MSEEVKKTMIDDMLENIKLSLRIDGDDDDALIKLCAESSFAYLKNAIGPDEDFYKDNSQVQLAIIMLTDHYYRVRSATQDGKGAVEPDLGTKQIILQLKPAYSQFIKEKGSD